MTANPTPPLSEAGLAAVLGEELRRQVYGLIVVRSEHHPTCQGDCAGHGCPVQVQDYGTDADVNDIAKSLAAVLYVAMLADREQAGRDALVAAADEIDRALRAGENPDLGYVAAKWLRQRAGEPT